MKYFLYYIIALCIYPAILSADNLGYNLSSAISRGDLQHARELIEKGADVNQKQEPFQQTPIIIAPLKGMEFVKLLLSSGADINAKDQDDNTALINACLYGELEIVKYLLLNGADIEVVNKDDMSVLDAAKLSENKQLIELIKNKIKN
jgi:ankyrin repeat protein